MFLDDGLRASSGMRKIFNHHEQASAMAAEAFARYSGKPACVCVTSGPGGTNAINGVQGAWADSIPMVVMSGFPRWETTALSSGLDIRTRGVQENDIIRMVSGITKYAVRVLDPLAIRSELTHAYRLAMEGRRGPVWIEVPLNIQGQVVDTSRLIPCGPSAKKEYPSLGCQIKELESMLRMSKRPCLLTGSGIRSGDCEALFRKFIERVRIPIVGGWQQGDICFLNQDRYFGTSGSPGPRAGNFILQNADLILILGNSLSHYQTGFNQEAFARDATLCMVDAQADEGKKPGLSIHFFIESDLKGFFSTAESMENISASADWMSYCKAVYTRFSVYESRKTNSHLLVSQADFWECFFEKAPKDAVIALGNSGCIAGALYKGVKHPDQRVLVNYKCGSMGHDLPNAIGAAVASNKDVFCVTGDGSIMMNLQELQTIRHYKLPVKIAVFNNGGYAAIRNTSKRYFDGEYVGADASTGVSFPEFKNIADAFGLPYRRCETAGQLEEMVAWYVSTPGACLLEVDERLDEVSITAAHSELDENGQFTTAPLHVMTPLLSEEEMSRWMPDWNHIEDTKQ